MNGRKIFTLVVGAILFTLSTAALTVAVGCHHRTDWALPWITISTSITRSGFAVRALHPIIFVVQLAVCFGLAWLLGLLVPIKTKQNGPNRLPVN